MGFFCYQSLAYWMILQSFLSLLKRSVWCKKDKTLCKTVVNFLREKGKFSSDQYHHLLICSRGKFYLFFILAKKNREAKITLFKIFTVWFLATEGKTANLFDTDLYSAYFSCCLFGVSRIHVSVLTQLKISMDSMKIEEIWEKGYKQQSNRTHMAIRV